jgi:hypothetical protein
VRHTQLEISHTGRELYCPSLLKAKLSSSSIKLEGALSGNVNSGGFPSVRIHSKHLSTLEIFVGRAEYSHEVTDVDCCSDPPLR